MNARRLLNHIFFALGGLTMMGAAQANSPGLAPLQAIENLDAQRYMGRWYEIAKFPNRFQTHCFSDTRADYRLLNTGRVEVINQCKTASGQMDVAKGSARFVGPEGSPKFEVRFAPEWMEFVPMVWGKYWVIDLDKDYTLAAVSEPKREFLWILSRTPVLDEKRWNALLARLEAMGLSIGKLERTPHGSP